MRTSDADAAVDDNNVFDGTSSPTAALNLFMIESKFFTLKWKFHYGVRIDGKEFVLQGTKTTKQ